MSSLLDIALEKIIEDTTILKTETVRYLPSVIQQKLLSLLITHNKLTDENVKGFMHEYTTSLKFSGASSCISDTIVDRLLDCTNLTQLSLYNCTNISEASIVRIFESNTNFVYINLAKCAQIGGSVLQSIKNSKNLRWYPFSFISLISSLILNRNPQLLDSHFFDCLSNWPNLSEFSILGCSNLKGEWLPELSIYNKNLSILTLSRCKSITNSSLLFPILQNCQNLSCLSISQMNREFMTDSLILQIGEYLNTRLVKFDASGSSSVKQQSLLTMLTQCPNLEIVSLPLDYDTIIECLAVCCTSLKEISLYPADVDKPSLYNRITALTELTNITVLNARRMSIETYSYLTRLSGLRELYVFGLNMPKDYVFTDVNMSLSIFYTGGLGTNIIDETVRPGITVSMCTSFPNLEYLNLSNAKLTPEAMSILGNLPKLSALDLSNSNVDDVLLEEFLKTIKSKIGIINLSVTAISDSGLLKLLYTLRKCLLDLNLTACLNIKSSFKPEKSFRTCVQRLILANCFNITESFVEILELMPNLSDLSITGCKSLVKPIESLVSVPLRMRFLDSSKIDLSAEDSDTLCRFIKKSPYLEVLNLADTGKYLTDSILIESLSNDQCKILQTLHVTNCSLVTDSFVEFMMENKPPLLQILALKGTKADRKTVEALQDKYPLLQVHFTPVKVPATYLRRNV